MSKIHNFKLFESSNDINPKILYVEDYIVGFLDKYGDKISSWIISEYLMDPEDYHAYNTGQTVDNGEYIVMAPSKEAPDGSIIFYDIKIDLDISKLTNIPIWSEEGFIDFDFFNSIINDLKNSLYRLDSKNIQIKMDRRNELYAIVLCIITNEKK